MLKIEKKHWFYAAMLHLCLSNRPLRAEAGKNQFKTGFELLKQNGYKYKKKKDLLIQQKSKIYLMSLKVLVTQMDQVYQGIQHPLDLHLNPRSNHFLTQVGISFMKLLFQLILQDTVVVTVRVMIAQKKVFLTPIRKH